jgi:hypothetical protein
MVLLVPWLERSAGFGLLGLAGGVQTSVEVGCLPSLKLSAWFQSGAQPLAARHEHLVAQASWPALHRKVYSSALTL